MQRWETAGGAVLEQRRQLAVDAARQTTTEREGELKRIVNQAAALARTRSRPSRSSMAIGSGSQPVTASMFPKPPALHRYAAGSSFVPANRS
jgi:hypothetical protein